MRYDVARERTHLSSADDGFYSRSGSPANLCPAFVALYVHDDSFWPIAWLGGILPFVFVATIVLTARDAWRRTSSGRQIGLTLVLVSLAFCFFLAITTTRFATRGSRTVGSVPVRNSGLILWVGTFSVCANTAGCPAAATGPETRQLHLEKVPEQCCALMLINGGRGKHEVESFRVTVNGQAVNFPQNRSPYLAPIELGKENIIAVDLKGKPEDYVWLTVTGVALGKKPPSQVQSR